MYVRLAIRKLLAPDFPDLAMLTYQELSSDLNIQPIAASPGESKRSDAALIVFVSCSAPTPRP
jgi:hypothetical protein